MQLVPPPSSLPVLPLPLLSLLSILPLIPPMNPTSTSILSLVSRAPSRIIQGAFSLSQRSLTATSSSLQISSFSSSSSPSSSSTSKPKKPQKRGYTKEFPPPPGSLAQQRPPKPLRTTADLPPLPETKPSFEGRSPRGKYRAELRWLRRNLEVEHLRNKERDRALQKKNIQKARETFRARKRAIRRETTVARARFTDGLSPHHILGPLDPKGKENAAKSEAILDEQEVKRRARIIERQEYEERLRREALLSLSLSAHKFVTPENIDKHIDDFHNFPSAFSEIPLRDYVASSLKTGSCTVKPFERKNALIARIRGYRSNQSVTLEALEEFERQEAAYSLDK
ncbi:MAG: hypothetical protein DHS80DRAFT_22031 [Piptocephalis tieghemiana]|nr:MAG: hypothetical protein DHS80DRAFT_22031 [Piptocephalis tieghemiana]